MVCFGWCLASVCHAPGDRLPVCPRLAGLFVCGLSEAILRPAVLEAGCSAQHGRPVRSAAHVHRAGSCSAAADRCASAADRSDPPPPPHPPLVRRVRLWLEESPGTDRPCWTTHVAWMNFQLSGLVLALFQLCPQLSVS